MPISPTAEILAIRHELAAQFDNNLDRIFMDLLRQQRESGYKYITLPKRSPIEQRMTKEPLNRSRDQVQTRD